MTDLSAMSNFSFIQPIKAFVVGDLPMGDRLMRDEVRWLRRKRLQIYGRRCQHAQQMRRFRVILADHDPRIPSNDPLGRRKQRALQRPLGLAPHLRLPTIQEFTIK
jgi:hypothetical protein